MESTLSEKIIPAHESEHVEFKSSLADGDRLIETICAFANRRGGTVWVGVSEEKGSARVKGVDIGKNTIESFVNKVVREVEPVLYPEVEVLEVDQKKILKVKINEGHEKPYTAFGRSFIRMGKSTQKMSQSDYQRLLYQRNKFYYDHQIAKDAALKDIARGKVRTVIRLSKSERNLDIPANISVDEFLKKLDLIREAGLTNAALLLFAKNPQRFFISAEVRCGRFKGNQASDPFIDMKVLRGSVFEQIDEAEKFVIRNIAKSAWTEPGKVRRQEKWEYPMDAVREAIANALAHRDYRSAANVQIRIFDDRLEIWNPGELPPGLTIEKLKGEHESDPRNPLIAQILFLIGYIEQWGTGTNKIIRDCKSHGLPPPKFEEKGNSFVVVFRKAKVGVPIKKEAPKLIFEELNETQRKILEYIREYGKAKGVDLERELKLNRRTVTRNLNSLSKKYLKWHGKSKKDPTAYYTLSGSALVS